MTSERRSVATINEEELAIADLIEEFAARLQAGESIDAESFAAEHPAYAEKLRGLLPGVQVLAVLEPSGSNADSEDVLAESRDSRLSGELGDFRILREVGKGGMGVVYEAEQISLRRRVALKVLPFAATMDPRHLQRFHNEAQAAACLHHTNIVPVFSVGSERGVHFYAMQFIDGQPLSEIIRQLCRLEKKASSAEEGQTVAYQPAPDEAVSTPLPGAAMTPLTGEGRRSRDYYRKVAELGVQVAEALDHAHQLGIVHRDIKPANLLLDGRGNLWVTDFGLAHMQHGEASLTGTGQMVGTPRYMSPEQALAKRVPIDHRTDVYSLGVTMYELLTLRPAFGSEDREELLRQIAFEEPPRPRRLERSIPAELEIIVLKAMEKRPQDRYATAQEFADDLRRWLLDQPIHARRPSWGQVARKWARRHQAAVRAASLLLFVFLAFGFGFAVWWVKQQTAAELEGKSAFDEAVRWQQDERWPEALSAIRRARAVLRGVGADENLRQKVDELGRDLEMAQKLDEARLQFTAVKDGHFDQDNSIAAYVEAFSWYGLEIKHEDAGAAAEFIRSRSIRTQLVAALDYWANLKRSTKVPEWKHLLAVARAADTDLWRNQFREAWEREDGKAMDDLLASAEVEKLLPTTLSLLRFSFNKPENISGVRAAALLRRAQQRHPADFWINHDLAMLLSKTKPPQLEEAIGFFRAAVAVRPQSPGVHLNLGGALHAKGQLDEAIAEFSEAIRVDKEYAEAHIALGNVLRDKGQLDDAIAQYREAIRLKKDFALAHNNLGNPLREKGRLDEAIAEYREAIRLKKDFAGAHNNLGIALKEKGQLDEAIAEYREAIRLKNDDAMAHDNLGNALHDKGQLDEAIAEYREAIRYEKENAAAHNNLGSALREKGQLDEAIDECREAIRLKKDSAEAHDNLGSALYSKGLLNEAIAEHREAIRIKKDYALAHDRLGSALHDKGMLDEAIAEHREAIRIKKDYAPAHYNLGNSLRDKGQLEEAIAEYREAIRLDKDYADAHNNLFATLRDKGRLDEAIAECRETIRIKKDDARYHCNLGTALHGKGQLEEAIAEYREAIRIQKDYAPAHYNLGIALGAKGQLDEALTEWREAIRLNKDYAEAYCNIGGLLEHRGLFTEALVYWRRGHELGTKIARWPYPSAQRVRNCERLVKLDGKLPAILSGQTQPADTAERLALASLCQLPCKKQHAATFRFYREAFADKPQLADDLNAQHRYNAACAAAQAGCGQGNDADKLDTKERARLRRQALDWLRADLKAYGQVLEKSAGKAGPAIAQRMQYWLKDADFAGVRGKEALAKLPEEERSAWRKFWSDVAEVLAKAQRRTPVEKKTNAE